MDFSVVNHVYFQPFFQLSCCCLSVSAEVIFKKHLNMNQFCFPALQTLKKVSAVGFEEFNNHDINSVLAFAAPWHEVFI